MCRQELYDLFGYVKVCKNELKIKDYNLYRAIYCGICMANKKYFGNIPRLTTNYEMTFLAAVLSAVSESDYKVKTQRCVLHPLRKRPVVYDCTAVDYAAFAGVILSYMKLFDDKKDKSSIKASLGMAFLKNANKKAAAEYDVLCSKVQKSLAKLDSLEKDNCGDTDIAADCFAGLMGSIFTPDFAPENEKKQLYYLGYYIGRWIYLIDAIADFENDKKTNSYNPYAVKYDSLENEKSKLELSMTFTLENASAAYELLDIKRNKGILDNIIYTGLPQEQEKILRGIANESL